MPCVHSDPICLSCACDGQLLRARICVGDSIEILKSLPSESIQCCVTSPPYWGLRDYGHAGQLGLEKTPEEYVAKMVAVFREVRRVLAKDGTLWLNLGDSYANVGKWGGSSGGIHASELHGNTSIGQGRRDYGNLKGKDLVGIPWMVAFALRADGWWLRSEIIWHKPNVMPSSVTDRPTSAHEQVFLLGKSARYYYNAAAVAEPVSPATKKDKRVGTERVRNYGQAASDFGANVSAARLMATNAVGSTETRNKRSVWTIPTQPYSGAHFATMPEALVVPCILAGSRPGSVVLDPFAGSGTVGVVALRAGRDFIGCELNPNYATLAKERIDASVGTALTEIYSAPPTPPEPSIFDA